MAATTAQKLGINPATTSLVLGMSASDALVLLGELPEGAEISQTAATGDLVLFFAASVGEIRRSVADAFARMREPGRCWVAYRKGASRSVAQASGEPALHRDTLQAALAEVGLDGVTLIAIDGAWSAMRIKRV